MYRPKNVTKKSPMSALPLNHCLAKTYITPQSTKIPGRNILEHSCITGEVARFLISMYPQTLREVFFPPGCAYVASVHDVGKVSPVFQKRLYSKIGDLPTELKDIIDLGSEEPWGFHSGVGQATLKACNTGNYLSDIVGRHHGLAADIKWHISTDPVLGGEAWHERRIELLEMLKSHFKETWPHIDSQTNADVVAGLTTVADWIGSGSLFEDPCKPWQDSIVKAVSGAGFQKADILPNLSFRDIFGIDPYPIQEQFFEACTGPGTYVLEAPIGKTEAALYAAYRLLSTNLATGIYFALPTILTSNKIHHRVCNFLQKILATSSPHTQPLLLHGKARLMDNLLDTEMGEDGAPGGEWFNSLKRAILAPFGVGTLDQALLAVLPDVRHSFVRTFGLLGKVVILDEVHTYDAYTGLHLDELTKVLRQLHCTVIILSATLTQERRSALLDSNAKHADYPLISALPFGYADLCETPAPPPSAREVALCLCDVAGNAIEEAIERASQGQQVLWIENTVAEAQDTYRILTGRIPSGVDHGLLHARFLMHDRMCIEDRWTGHFGKDGCDRSEKGRILVGTQVLEQSLDIDADFLVTRFCPVDMFLQRLGRLWRHERQNRASSAQCEAWLLAPSLSEIPTPDHFGKSGYVYDKYVLFRSYETLANLSAVHLPGQIRDLIENTYAERQECDPLLQKFKAESKKQADHLESLARMAQTALGQSRKDNIATRYSNLDSTPVLLVQKLKLYEDGFHLTFVGGGEEFFPTNVKSRDKHEWRRLACLLNSNILSIAERHAPDGAIPNSLKNALRNFIFIGKDNEDARLHIAVVTESGELRAMDGNRASEKYRLEYQEHLGYVAIKKHDYPFRSLSR